MANSAEIEELKRELALSDARHAEYQKEIVELEEKMAAEARRQEILWRLIDALVRSDRAWQEWLEAQNQDKSVEPASASRPTNRKERPVYEVIFDLLRERPMTSVEVRDTLNDGTTLGSASGSLTYLKDVKGRVTHDPDTHKYSVR